jgi:hypothetical protein
MVNYFWVYHWVAVGRLGPVNHVASCPSLVLLPPQSQSWSVRFWDFFYFWSLYVRDDYCIADVHMYAPRVCFSWPGTCLALLIRGIDIS